MNHFEITGWKLATLTEAGHKALLLLKELAGVIDELAIEAHCQDLKTLQHFSETLPSERCAAYCWRRITDGRVFEEEHFRALRRAYLVFQNCTISINDVQELPPRDWNERAPEWSLLSLTTSHSAPLKPEDKQPSPRIVESLSKLGMEAVERLPEPVTTITSWKDSGREHSYFLKVPRNRLPGLASNICSHFRFRDGVGSFEFLGSVNRLTSIHQAEQFHFKDFPPTCWNLNYPADTAISFGASVFLLPVPNISSQQLLLAASLIDRLAEKVQYLIVVKRYIPGRLSETSFTPRVQGNYLLISQQKTGDYAIFLGFERYEDKDPTVRQFTSFAAPVIERMGAKLKKVIAPRS